MEFKIISFYIFKELNSLDNLKVELHNALVNNNIFGTIIIAPEGCNAMISAKEDDANKFLIKAEKILGEKIIFKSNDYHEYAFDRQKIKIKKEIITFKRPVDINKGKGTHVDAKTWNKIISQDDVYLLDTRNHYEYKAGTFKGAIDPKTKYFNELPDFIEKNMNPKKHKKVAMFCTGGIRCEKFAPYLKDKGFEEVYQLEGGILKYLEDTDKEDSLWQGECYVFDKRVSVNEDLKAGDIKDNSYDLKYKLIDKEMKDFD